MEREEIEKQEECQYLYRDWTVIQRVNELIDSLTGKPEKLSPEEASEIKAKLNLFIMQHDYNVEKVEGLRKWCLEHSLNSTILGKYAEDPWEIADKLYWYVRRGASK
jgi:hypothetical protein